MTKQEFGQIAFLLSNGWPGEFGEGHVAAYAEFLMPYEFEAVKAALHKLAQQGTRFVPSVGLIIAAVRELVDGPVLPWTEAWQQIEQSMRMNAIPDDSDSLVAQFVEREGLQRLRMMPFYDPDHGELRIHQLRTRWEEFVDVQQTRRSHELALQSSGLRELERVRVRLLERSVEMGP